MKLSATLGVVQVEKGAFAFSYTLQHFRFIFILFSFLKQQSRFRWMCAHKQDILS